MSFWLLMLAAGCASAAGPAADNLARRLDAASRRVEAQAVYYSTFPATFEWVGAMEVYRGPESAETLLYSYAPPVSGGPFFPRLSEAGRYVLREPSRPEILATVIIDPTPPVSFLSAATLADCGPRGLEWLHGRARDDLSGVKTVRGALRRKISPEWWDGREWNSARTWLKADGTTEWRLPFPNILQDQVDLILSAVDRAGAKEAPHVVVIDKLKRCR